MSVESIRLDFLPAVEDITIGKLLKVTFQFPDMEHSTYGKVNDLQGSIDLVLPQGSFPLSNFYTLSAAEQESLLTNYVHRLRKLHEELDNTELTNRFRDWLIFCSLIFPNENVHSQIFQSALDIFAIIFQLDDIADDESLMSELAMSSNALYRRYDSWKACFDNANAEAYAKLGRQFPLLQNGLSHLSLALNEIIEYVPGLRDRLRFTNRAIFESAETVPLVTLDMNGDILSEEALQVVRGRNAGFQIALEYIAAIEGLVISSKVRQSFLFELFLNSYNLGAGLLNDIFGLNKDLAKSASMDNCILRQVARQGMSYRKAFKKTLDLLRSTTKDMNLAGRKLIETFPEESFLPKFIQHAEYIFDGQIYSYLLLFKLNGRYGTIDFQIVEQ